MNVNIFQMDQEEAQRKILAYRRQLKRRANEEYELALKAYQTVAEGLAILNLYDAFAQTGLGEDFRPRLAIGRADRKEVHVYVDPRDRCLTFTTHSRGMWTGNYQGDLMLHLPFEFTLREQNALQHGKHGYALVPMIPADVRELVEGQDKDYMILWEVEKWADRSLTSPPPRDPYLLKHIAGELYAVVAEWDLTDLERAVMSSRNRR